MRRHCLGLIFVAGAVLSAARLWASDTPVVALDTGQIRGTEDNGVAVYRGIPYAAPPLGDLRWRPPQPSAKWKGVRDATEFGASCPQSPNTPTFLAGPLKKIDENCLFLNVWTPSKSDGARRPVMVWIHGGGFFTGSGSEAEFDGTPYADRGIILVTINYRIGRLGFFAHPALTKESKNGLVGNYGYMDVIAALEWVRRNIGAFGGDPSNVTLFGESAGAMAIDAMLASPLAAGLFQKAIIESGPVGPTGPRPLAAAESLGTAFAERHGIKGDGPDTVVALRALTAETIAPMKPAADDTRDIMAAASPMIDGKLLPVAPIDAIAEGKIPKIPVIIGANSLESRVWLFGGPMPTTISIVPATADQIFGRLGDDRESVLTAYRKVYGSDPERLAAAIAADRFMGVGTRLEARFLAKAGAPVFVYRFAGLPTPVRGATWGAPHGTEIYYVFGTLEKMPGVGPRMTDEDRALSRTMIDYWASFAKTGEPVGRGLAIWPAYHPDNERLMEFTDHGSAAVAWPNTEGLSLLEAHLEKLGRQPKP